MTVYALLRYLERYLKRDKLFLRSDHLFLIEIPKILKRFFGLQLARIKIIIRDFFMENAGDYLIDALIEFGKLIDQ